MVATFTLGQLEPQRHSISLEKLLCFGTNELKTRAFRGVQRWRCLAIHARDRRTICDSGLMLSMNTGRKHGKEPGHKKNQQAQKTFHADARKRSLRRGEVLGIFLGRSKQRGTGGEIVERAESEHGDE